MRKVIFLVDMNAFFITCEATRNPALRGKPAAVAGDPQTRTGIILAASYEARAFGVRTTMLLHEALRLCPQLVIVPPDHDFYEQKSRQVMDLLHRYSPLIEQNSIDEAWLDMTGSESLFGPPREAAKNIMDAISSQLGLACSIGISENKFLAKMASDMKKPQGITELWPEDIPRLLWPLPAAAMIGIGRKTAEKLAHIGLKTIGDLAKADEAFLVELLGKFGREISWRARGIDLDPVNPHEDAVAKSIGRSTTLPADVSDLGEARRILLALAEDVAHSARQHGQKGRTVQVTLKYADFSLINRQTSVAATCTTQDIFLAAAKLMAENWHPERPVRLIGVSLSGFATNSGQISLFDSADEIRPDQRLARGDQAMDRIRDKLGPGSVMRASLLEKPGTPKKGSLQHEASKADSMKPNPSEPEPGT